MKRRCRQVRPPLRNKKYKQPRICNNPKYFTPKPHLQPKTKEEETRFIRNKRWVAKKKRFGEEIPDGSVLRADLTGKKAKLVKRKTKAYEEKYLRCFTHIEPVFTPPKPHPSMQVGGTEKEDTEEEEPKG